MLMDRPPRLLFGVFWQDGPGSGGGPGPGDGEGEGPSGGGTPGGDPSQGGGEAQGGQGQSQGVTAAPSGFGQTGTTGVTAAVGANTGAPSGFGGMGVEGGFGSNTAGDATAPGSVGPTGFGGSVSGMTGDSTAPSGFGYGSTGNIGFSAPTSTPSNTTVGEAAQSEANAAVKGWGDLGKALSGFFGSLGPNYGQNAPNTGVDLGSSALSPGVVAALNSALAKLGKQSTAQAGPSATDFGFPGTNVGYPGLGVNAYGQSVDSPPGTSALAAALSGLGSTPDFGFHNASPPSSVASSVSPSLSDVAKSLGGPAGPSLGDVASQAANAPSSFASPETATTTTSPGPTLAALVAALANMFGVGSQNGTGERGLARSNWLTG